MNDNEHLVMLEGSLYIELRYALYLYKHIFMSYNLSIYNKSLKYSNNINKNYLLRKYTYHRKKYINRDDAIYLGSYMFTWINTNEGYNYWRNIYLDIREKYIIKLDKII